MLGAHANATSFFGEKFHEPLIPKAKGTLSVCVVSCTTSSRPSCAVHDVAKGFGSLAPTSTVLLSETDRLPVEGEKVRVVPKGTKLSKIRCLAHSINADFICLCDPDLTVRKDACRTVLQQALEKACAGKEIVAFGIVEGRDDGTLLSQIISMDKWLSHRVLRPFLWAAGIGITVPGQFLIISSSLLRNLDPTVDSYLDDLYVGWIARQRGATVLRIPVVVGEEDPRSCWVSLLAQRIRWMKGIASLVSQISKDPLAVGLFGTHYIAYHGLPILLLTAILLLGIMNPFAGFSLGLVMVVIFAIFSGRPLGVCIAFLSIFPLIHVFVTFAWWIPLTHAALTRR